MFEETPLAATGLKLQQVPMEEVQQALQDSNNTESDFGNVDLGRWQPDFILISWKHKRIAVVDLTRPSDVLSVQLEEAYRSKKQKYGPVRSALHHYIREGWTIVILIWVIGTRDDQWTSQYGKSPEGPLISRYTSAEMESHHRGLSASLSQSPRLHAQNTKIEHYSPANHGQSGSAGG